MAAAPPRFEPHSKSARATSAGSRPRDTGGHNCERSWPGRPTRAQTPAHARTQKYGASSRATWRRPSKRRSWTTARGPGSNVWLTPDQISFCSCSEQSLPKTWTIVSLLPARRSGRDCDLLGHMPQTRISAPQITAALESSALRADDRSRCSSSPSRRSSSRRPGAPNPPRSD
jgi:hypothetical protein